jgi:hypothetical protein
MACHELGADCFDVAQRVFSDGAAWFSEGVGFAVFCRTDF